MGGLLITYYLIKRIRKKRRLNSERIETGSNKAGQNGMADQDPSYNSGCLMPFANVFIWLVAKRSVRQLDDDPEIIEATRKAHDAMVDLKGSVDELMERREKMEMERIDRHLRQSEPWIKQIFEDAARGAKGTKTTIPSIGHPQQDLSKDKTTYIFEAVAFSKSRLVNAVVRSYVRKNTGITYDELKRAFPDELQGSYGVFTLKENAIRILKVKGIPRHYLKENELIQLKDSVIATSTEWRKKNIGGFIARAMTLDIKIEIKR
jgi:hypothetical protein